MKIITFQNGQFYLIENLFRSFRMMKRLKKTETRKYPWTTDVFNWNFILKVLNKEDSKAWKLSHPKGQIHF